MNTQNSINHSPNRKWLQGISILEGTTLLLLVGLGVPLKHLFNHAELVSLLGPVHGSIVLVYIWLTLNVATYEQWKTTKLFSMIGVALIPFGGYFAARKLAAEEGMK